MQLCVLKGRGYTWRFDIDGMLFEFVMNFLNIFFVFNFMFSSRFMLFPTLKKIGVKKNSGGGGC